MDWSWESDTETSSGSPGDPSEELRKMGWPSLMTWGSEREKVTSERGTPVELRGRDERGN